ncbi:outer membrane beta-barrel protein [Daejeonella sp.]|uniref:outer membrane beta-barrel protein n=1 Tax=Daejeonella sp. TaxID=2805397 RepID=UPI0030C0C4A1
MLKRYIIIACMALPGLFAQAQTVEPVTPLVVSGSADVYYKYDLSTFKSPTGGSNIPTSFANDQNSISLGMLNLILSKSVGKASFVGDVSFGARGQYQSIPNGNGDPGNMANSFNIQNLYVKYQFNEAFSMTGGYMGTFVGYEVISPIPNVNYSTSYLFTNGPFQNAGLKANYSFSSKVGLMVGLFNDWNTYQDLNGVSHIGAQLSLNPTENWSAFINVLSGRSAAGAATYGSGTILDLTTTYKINEVLKIGLNAADYTLPENNGGYSGVAVYPQVALSNSFTLGTRGEYFAYKDGVAGPGTSVVCFTVSGNIRSGALNLIPEVRLDNNGSATFFKNNLTPTKTASQVSLAAVYSF